MTLTSETQRPKEINDEGREDDRNARSAIPYVVYPEDGFPSDGTHPLQQLLESFGPQSVTKLHTQISTVIGIMFWTLHPTPSEVKILEENSMVTSVTPQRLCDVFC
ncbi:hypothetical protein OCU04_003894 [Sclerotinia nivalis]|uniref:Uncharacterized protein n=1 Tax=Sclerotinia nivalis TaxID=352851 RepID=A0A9X0ASV4_9HELO|nr:hypothetical protein OCU04_003894 [Sclerotinia nivalis]